VIASLVTAAFALAGSTITPCLILGIWWRRTTAAGALSGLVVGTVLSLTAMIIGWADIGPGPTLLTPAFVVIPVVLVVIVAVSLVTKPVADADEIWLRLHGSAQDRATERIARVTLEAGQS
jgi:cation/acetate symporter